MMIPTPMAQPYSPTSGLRSRADEPAARWPGRGSNPRPAD